MRMKGIEHVGIIGMGALGMLYGNMIRESLGADHVSFILDNQRYEKYQDERYEINGAPVSFTKVKAEDAKPCDLLIVAVKYNGLESALETMKNAVGDDTIIISVMNGITSEEIIGQRYGMDKVIYTVAQGMDVQHFGSKVWYTRSGQLCVGVTDPQMQEKLDCLMAFFDQVHMAYTAETDIMHRLWGKLMLNVGVNQTCMVYGKGYQDVQVPGSQEYMTLISAMREVMLVANAEHVGLTEEDLRYYVDLIKTFPAEATPSMGQDRMNKRCSEVELFAGTVIRYARKHDILVPANEFLYKRVYEIEAEY